MEPFFSNFYGPHSRCTSLNFKNVCRIQSNFIPLPLRLQPHWLHLLREIFQKIHSSIRNNPKRSSVRKGILRNFVKSTGKHLCQFEAYNFVKKRLWHSCIPIIFLQNTSGRLPLQNLLREINISDIFQLINNKKLNLVSSFILKYLDFYSNKINTAKLGIRYIVMEITLFRIA